MEAAKEQDLELTGGGPLDGLAADASLIQWPADDRQWIDLSHIVDIWVMVLVSVRIAALDTGADRLRRRTVGVSGDER